ncbi:hypothetical protein [Hymenobacter psoromatis]|uniref:hypothetical protein n=1 Tax=Hymenobacter psoromatis TaxID=1484116 RepID=UPI001CC0ADB6|nr:hypothetical protein [Hymenobacter psoromatis]
MPFLLRLLLVAAAGGCIVGARLATRHCLGQRQEASRPYSRAAVGSARLVSQLP